MKNNQLQITQKGLDALKLELNDLVENKRPKVVDRLSNARLQGDLSENSDYHNAKDELEFLDGRISELEDVLKYATVVKQGAKNGGIALGTHVTLKFNGNQLVYEIVGDWEADPMKKKISHTSPLGQALFGKKIGDKVEVDAPAGKISYEILSIE
ncbi:MAG: Transcription elongation factor [Candidatus Woesebacteria bacterium GW2011_GWA1_37_8]|uniref:Transcription elongation factor GreA n=2 Tax=Candidatus Woeseibacteriota TaxID=1752722 RepID=A0A0G0PEV3_9BACT|nr:MAG: Transcription elongation factor [Microgenomates group bacterium GW2011_GWC1_37_12b]KKQ44967.1 MAG: Transcription elongation factor [Candidatus Woesebacteria bacterium GW2011_GWA1_37_8]KKQ87816.1 MAG: Transcription elongation factor [Candidatus Woesebacteria bacterium GW2011_GWB1_38_8b]